MCWTQFLSWGGVKGGFSVEAANEGGQQLFFANLHVAMAKRGGPRLARKSIRLRRELKPRSIFHPVEHVQLLLFDLDRDLVAGQARGFSPPPNPEMAKFIDEVLTEHAARHGWGATTTNVARRGMAIVLSLQDTPGALVKATEVLRLQQIQVPARRLLDILSTAELLNDDRVAAIHAWFAGQIADLPAQMRSELHAWFDVMLHGSSTPPRRRPRSETTIRIHLYWAIPALRTWTAAGRLSLREVSIDDVWQTLPPTGNPRSTMGQGLRSLFSTLKGLHVVFSNPLNHVPIGSHQSRPPMPLALDTIRDALNSPNPARAALAALVAFHALRAGELRHLQLTDLRDGRLHLRGRNIPLPEPVRTRIAAWLDYRNNRWPASVNPHLFLNKTNAIRTTAPGTQWLFITLGVSVRAIREDRILQEIQACNGDVRRLSDLFGISLESAARYAETIEHPAFADFGGP